MTSLYLTDVISVGTTHRGTQPDLLVGSLLVEDVDTELAELHCQHPIREGGVPSGELLVVLYQLIELITDALQRLVGQSQVSVLLYFSAISPRKTQQSHLTRFDVRAE